MELAECQLHVEQGDATHKQHDAVRHQERSWKQKICIRSTEVRNYSAIYDPTPALQI